MRYLCFCLLFLLWETVTYAQTDTPPTPWPTATPRVPLVEELTTRRPEINELEGYLLFHLQRQMAPDGYPPGNLYLDSDSLEYIDINADGEDDLIVNGYVHLAVLLWQGQGYAPPFQIYPIPTGRIPDSRYYLEDWTNDGNPEIVFDTRLNYVGTNLGGSWWTRYIIHCDEVCRTVFEVERLNYMVNSSDDGEGLQQTQTLIERTIEAGTPSIITTTTGINLRADCCYEERQTREGWSLSIGQPEPMQRKYTWDGQIFRLVEETVLEPDTVPSVSMPQLRAETPDYLDPAIISIGHVDLGLGYDRFDTCALFIWRDGLGEPVTCIPEFTKVEWRDLTRDGEPELVLGAVTGGASYLLRVYHFDRSQQGVPLVEIAEVTGDIIQADLLGVRIDDIDDDGALEIISTGPRMINLDIPPGCAGMQGAPCWIEPRTEVDIYEWDGTEFVLDRTMPILDIIMDTNPR